MRLRDKLIKRLGSIKERKVIHRADIFSFRLWDTVRTTYKLLWWEYTEDTLEAPRPSEHINCRCVIKLNNQKEEQNGQEQEKQEQA